MLFTYKKTQAKCNISCTFVLGFTNMYVPLFPPYICTLYSIGTSPTVIFVQCRVLGFRNIFLIKNVVLRC